MDDKSKFANIYIGVLLMILPALNLMMAVTDKTKGDATKGEGKDEDGETINRFVSWSGWPIVFALGIFVIQIGLIAFFRNTAWAYYIISIMWFVFLIIYEAGMNIRDDIDLNYYSPWISNFQKNVKSPNTIDAMKIFKIIYTIIAVVILIASNKDNKIFNMMALVICAFIFQIINSGILNQFINKNIYPSVFIYLDEYMINSDIKGDRGDEGLIFHIIGVVRLLILFALSFAVGVHFYKKDSIKISLLAFYSVFISLIVMWQLFIGDECILDRTLKTYNNKEYEIDDGETFIPASLSGLLNETIQAQGGATFNVILLLLSTVN